MRKVLMIIFAIILVGCAVKPESMGIDSLKWGSMTDKQRQEAIDNYNEINSYAHNSKIDTTQNRIRVKVSGGEVMLPPDSEYNKYFPVSFILYEGECRKVLIHAKNSKSKSWLISCYRDNKLLLDPGVSSSIKTHGSINIPESPLWQWGHTYRQVTSSGISKLLAVSVYVKAIGELKGLAEPISKSV